MLSNAYFLANFRFDTAENEPAKNLQNVANLPILLDQIPSPAAGVRRKFEEVSITVQLVENGINDLERVFSEEAPDVADFYTPLARPGSLRLPA